MFPAFVEAVAGRRFQTLDAVLTNYQTYGVIDEVASQAAGTTVTRPYAALIHKKGVQTEGKLLLWVNDDSLALLDKLEPEYMRRPVMVWTEQGFMSAQTYVADIPRERLAGPWDPETFEEHLLAYRNASRTGLDSERFVS